MEGQTVGSKPLITDVQWRKIEKILPPKMCDRDMITAILFREFSGRSLTETAEIFDLTRVRLHQWQHALEADGSLQKVMATLKLESAGALARARTGERPRHHNNPEMLAAITTLRLQGFRDALA